VVGGLGWWLIWAFNEVERVTDGLYFPLPHIDKEFPEEGVFSQAPWIFSFKE